ncbi:MAG: LysR family transcriptional regulator [Halieaceae bacterium]|nr:LysR family transcriptional regulator [Halieaceae bacterium]
MDTELLRTFLEVKATRHFGRAADNLFITQAAVSARIKQLESYFGAPLFHRDRNNIQLTLEGERLVPHAESILISLLRARQDLALREGGDLRLSVGVRQGLWCDTLQARLDQLHDEVADLKLHIETLSQEMLAKKLRDGALDTALVFDTPAAPELESHRVGDLRLRLFAHQSIKNLAEAVSTRYIYLQWGTAFSRFHVRQVAKDPIPYLQTNMVDAAIAQVQRQQGACFFPEALQASLLEQGICRVSDAPEFDTPLTLLVHPYMRTSSLVRRLKHQLNNLNL